MPRKPLAERFAEKVNTEGPISLVRGVEGPCWTWTGATRGTTGQFGERYGSIRVNGRLEQAHRQAYEAANGPVPPGLVLDHRCRRRNCVRPSHLEPVDFRTNTLRGVAPAALNARKKTCDSGHDLTDPQNLILRSDRPGHRECRECSRRHKRDYRERQTAARSTTYAKAA